MRIEVYLCVRDGTRQIMDAVRRTFERQSVCPELALVVGVHRQRGFGLRRDGELSFLRIRSSSLRLKSR